MLGLAGCSAPRSERCKEVCERESECAEDSDDEEFKFDKSECVAACTALERDTEGQVKVEKHAECVKAANGCKEIYACELE